MKKATPILAVAAALLAACGQNVGQGDGQTGQGFSQPRTEETGGSMMVHPPIGGAGLALDAPAEWEEQTPSSRMRKAQYRLPSEGGDAEVVIFFFGPGQGGTVKDNLERWKSQFSGGGEAEVSQMEVGGMPVTVLDVSGTYNSGMMMGGGGPMEGHRMRAAIFSTPGGNWFVRLLGPEAAVAKWKEGFDTYLTSARMAE